MAKRHRIATTFFLISAGCVSIPALTDAGGYPLVGNVMAKGGGPKPKPQPQPKPHPNPDGAHRADSGAGPAGPEGIA